MANDVIAKLADGTELHFPEGTTSDVVSRVVKSHISGTAPGVDIPDANAQAHAAIMNTPMEQSQLGESANGVPTASDIVQATTPAAFAAKHPVMAASAVPGALLGAAAAPAGVAGAALTGAAGAGMGTQVTQALSGENPLTPANLTETAKNTVIGGGVGAAAGAISPLAKWIGASKSGGAQALELASQKAGSAPVQLSPESDAILDKIVRQSKLGGTVPKAISDLLDRTGQYSNPDTPLTYDDARTLQSNISSLSANEKMALKGELRYLIPQFAKSFAGDVQAGADAAGVGDIHRAGMQAYAQASQKGRAVDTAKDLLTDQALKGAAYTGGGLAVGGTVYGLIKKFSGH